MATPFVAGSSALVLAVKGKSAAVATGARTLFQATAQPISSSRTGGDPFQTVTQQGAGLIQVYDAIFGTTLLSRTELILNDTAHFTGPWVDSCVISPPISDAKLVVKISQLRTVVRPSKLIPSVMSPLELLLQLDM
jgi:hypothetical protein